MTAVAEIQHIRGETITFGLRSDPEYDGTEVVTCDVKVAENGREVPDEGATVVFSIGPVFVPANGGERAYWSFTITPAQSAALSRAKYITDAKITYTTGVVDYAAPLVINLTGRVTA